MLPTDWLATINQLVETIFFAVIIVVTVLTYLKVKKTLLQPINTEVFKLQLSAFKEILHIFRGKSEIDLRDDIDLMKMANVNLDRLFDKYYHIVHGFKPDIDNSSYSPSNCPEGIIISTDSFRRPDRWVLAQE